MSLSAPSSTSVRRHRCRQPPRGGPAARRSPRPRCARRSQASVAGSVMASSPEVKSATTFSTITSSPSVDRDGERAGRSQPGRCVHLRDRRQRLAAARASRVRAASAMRTRGLRWSRPAGRRSSSTGCDVVDRRRGARRRASSVAGDARCCARCRRARDITPSVPDQFSATSVVSSAARCGSRMLTKRRWVTRTTPAGGVAGTGSGGSARPGAGRARRGARGPRPCRRRTSRRRRRGTAGAASSAR